MNLYSTFPVGWRWVLLFVWKCFWFVSPLESWLVGHWWLGVVMDGSSLSTLFRYIVPHTHSLLLLFSNAAILSSVTLFFFFYFSLSFSSFYFPPVFHLIPFWLSRPLFFFPFASFPFKRFALFFTKVYYDFRLSNFFQLLTILLIFLINCWFLILTFWVSVFFNSNNYLWKNFSSLLFCWK